MSAAPEAAWRRYRPQLVALLVGLLAVVGLRAVLQDDGDDDPGARATTTSAAADPRSSSSTAGEPATTDGGADAREDLDLQGVALRLDDLPSGWAVAEAAPLQLCPEADPAREVPPSDSYQVAYSGGSTGPFIGNVVAALPNEARAEAFLDAASSAIDACERFELDGAEVDVERIDGGDHGDASVAARVTGAGELPTDGTVHYVQVGRHVVTIAYVSVGSGGGTEVVDAAIKAVVSRLEG